MSNLYVTQQNAKAALWESGGGSCKTIQMNGQDVHCELDENGVIKNEFLRQFDKVSNMSMVNQEN